MLDLQISFSVKYYYLILVIIKALGSYLQRLWDFRPIRPDPRGRTPDERLLSEGDEAYGGREAAARELGLEARCSQAQNWAKVGEEGSTGSNGMGCFSC